MIRPIHLSKMLEERYKDETPEQRAQRYKENKERTQRMLDQWKEFAEKYPDIARTMIGAAA